MNFMGQPFCINIAPITILEASVSTMNLSDLQGKSSTSANVSAWLSSLNAIGVSVVQWINSLSKSVRGQLMVTYPWWTSYNNQWVPRTHVVASQSWVIHSCTTITWRNWSWLPFLWPKYSTRVPPKLHFDLLAFNSFVVVDRESVVSNPKCCCRSFPYIRISSLKTNTNSLKWFFYKSVWGF